MAEPSTKKFLSLAIPNVLTSVTIPIAGLVDTALLGHLRSVAPLAGVALATIIFDFLYWGFTFLRMGTTGLTGRAYGKGDEAEQGHVLHRALVLSVGLGLLVWLLIPAIESFGFYILSGEAAVEAEGLAYYRARIFGAVAVFCTYAMSGWLIGMQKPKAVLAIALSLNGLNIILDYYFIFILQWGAAGAGWATMISEWVAFVVAIVLVLRIQKQVLKPDWKAIFHLGPFKEMLTLNTNIMLRTLSLIACFSYFTNVSAVFGTMVLAGNAVLMRLLSTVSYFIDGFAYALESLAGEYGGAKNRPALFRSLKMGLGLNMIAIVGFMLVFWLGQEHFIPLLTNQPPVMAHVAEYLPFLFVVILISGFAYIFDGFFIRLAKGMVLRNSMILAAVVGFFPIAILGYQAQSVSILWWAMVAFMAMRTLSLGWVVRQV